MENDDDMFEEAYSALQQSVIQRCTTDTNIANIYRSLVNRQLNFEAPYEFMTLYPPNNNHYVKTCIRIAKKYDMKIDSVTAMISIGITHKTALKLCRYIARHFGKTFNLDTYCLSDDCMEEGEIEEDVFVYLRDIGGQYLYSIASYYRVHFA
jgi:hypothetical protein